MAILSRDILKGYFRTGAYPTEAQFASLIDSMLHHADKVALENVEGLPAALNGKASYASVAELLRLRRLKELVQFYCEDGYGGRPLFSLAMANWAQNCYVDPEDDRGVTSDDVQNITDIYISGKSEYYTRLLTAYTKVSGVTLQQGVNTLGFIDGAPLSFTAALASSEHEGLMSAEDKAIINGISGLLSGKEDKVTVVNVASGTSSITAEAGKYYNIAGTVGTLDVTLPTPTDTSKVLSIGFFLTTGAAIPSVSFGTSPATTVYYYDGWGLEAATTYEINALYNGSNWVLAYGIIS